MDNVLLSSLKKINLLLPSNIKKKGVIVYLLILLNSVFDLFGLAILFPLFGIVLTDQFLKKYPIVNLLYTKLHFQNERAFIVFLCVTIFIVFVLKNIFSILINYVQSRFSLSIYEYLTDKIFKTVFNKGFLFFSNNNSNEVINNITSVPLFFARGLVFNVIFFINELVILLFIIIALSLYDFRIIVILLIVIVPFFSLFFKLTKRKIHKIGVELNELDIKSRKPLYEVFFGFVDVKLSGTDNYFIDKYHKQVAGISRLNTFSLMLNYIPMKMVEISTVLVVVIMLLYGVYFMDSKSDILELLSVLGIASLRTIPVFNRMLNSLMQIKAKFYSFDIFDKYIDKDDIKINQEVIKFNETIKFNNISFAYPSLKNKLILDEISLTVNKGETIGFIGESGSGKTTIMKVLVRLLIEDKGNIEIDNVLLSQKNVTSWRSRIGYVKQNTFILDGTLIDNIAFGVKHCDVDLKKIHKIIDQVNLRKLVESLPKKLNSSIGERGTLLSGGQVQRISIARALYHGADIFIFDEATSALDTQTEKEITESISKLNTKSTTIFIIAHRYTTLRNCDKIIEFKDGKISNIFNSYEDLIKKTSYLH